MRQFIRILFLVGSASSALLVAHATDACTQIQSEINALPSSGGIVDATNFQGAQTCATTVSVGNSTQQVTLKLGVAAFSGSANPLFIVDRASSLLLSAGTTIHQTCSTCNAVILAGTGPQWITGGISGPGEILGPGASTSSVGIVVGGSGDQGNSETNAANATRIEGVKVAGFGTGIKLGNNVWAWTLYHASIGDTTNFNGIGISVLSGSSKTGEELNVIGSAIFNSVNQAIDAPGFAEFYISQTSIDNDGNGTSSAAITSSGTNNLIECYGCHFEQNSGGPDTRDYIDVTNGTVVLLGGVMTRNSNLHGSMISVYGTTVANNVSVQGTFFGGVNATITNALSATGNTQVVWMPGAVGSNYQNAANLAGITGPVLEWNTATGGTYINGSLSVNGTITGQSKNFQIDDPLDPANKYLRHASVESPEMMNIYSGDVLTNKSGFAIVTLPPYFEALNREFRYQLTPIGHLCQATVVREIENNRFVLKTSKPFVKVSWQVTGVRHDPYANANRIRVEEEKPLLERDSLVPTISQH